MNEYNKKGHRDWATPREEVELMGSTLIRRDPTGGVGMSKWLPRRWDAEQAFSTFGRPVTIYPVADRDGPSFIVVTGTGAVAQEALESFLTGYRELYPEVKMAGRPAEVGPLA